MHYLSFIAQPHLFTSSYALRALRKTRMVRRLLCGIFLAGNLHLGYSLAIHEFFNKILASYAVYRLNKRWAEMMWPGQFNSSSVTQLHMLEDFIVRIRKIRIHKTLMQPFLPFYADYEISNAYKWEYLNEWSGIEMSVSSSRTDKMVLL